MHREPFSNFRRIVEMLARPGDGAEARYQLACQLLDQLLDSERFNPPCSSALEILRNRREDDRALVADCLLNPLEHSYDLDAFFELLDCTGFRLTSWLHPAEWKLENYLTNKTLLARSQFFEPDDEWRFVYHGAGYAGPLLEAVIERSDAPERSQFGPDELFAMPLACCHEKEIVQVHDGVVVARGRLPTYVIEDQKLRGSGSGLLGGRLQFSLPAYAQPLLRALDGKQAAGDALCSFVDDYGEPAVRDLIAKLTLDFGMIAPL